MKYFLQRRCWSGVLVLLVVVAAGSGFAQDAEKKAEKVGEPAKPAAAQESTVPPQDRASGLPPGVLARVNGKDITVEDYVGYLFASLGRSRLDEFIDRLLIEEEAKRLEITVSPEQVEAAVEERIDRTVKGIYQGNRDRFVETLARRRTSLEEEKSRLRQDLYYDSLWSEVILKGRKVTEEDLRQQFVESYGEGGVQYVVRHILISTRKVRGSDEPLSKTEAREKAEKVLQELQGGADFVQAVKKYSDDAFTRRNDGRIPHYRKKFYGDGFHHAVSRLTKESPLSGVVESPRGYHIIQLVDKHVTEYEDVKEELSKAVESRPPTPRERHEVIQRLREKAKIEGL